MDNHTTELGVKKLKTTTDNTESQTEPMSHHHDEDRKIHLDLLQLLNTLP